MTAIDNPMQQDDPKRQAELDRLMTAAHVHRRRGDYAQAEQAVKKALDIDSSNLDAREFAADILYARGALEVAAEEYKRLFSEDKTRATAEEKYARAIVQIAEAKRQKDLMREMIENPSQFRIPARNPLYAAVLSLAPGLGHAYCGQLIKGIILFLATTCCWLLFYALSPQVPGPSEVDPRALAEQGGPISWFLKNLGAPALAFACVAIFIQIYALIDAPVLAGKLRERDGKATAESQ